MEKVERNSSIEVLRILCVLGILVMHEMEWVLNEFDHLGGMSTFIFSVCNISSSCLMIISGYFGMKLKINKVIRIESMFIFWNLCAAIFSYLNGYSMERSEILAIFLPIQSGRSWFVSGYMYILFLSPFINKISECLNKEKFKYLLTVLLLLFSLLPTIFYFEITGTNGKGIIHLFIMYLLGRYIRNYYVERKGIHIILGIIVLMTGGMNIVAENIGMRFWFSRDCSFLIVAGAVCSFLLFSKWKYTNRFINSISTNVLSVILGERLMRAILQNTYVGGDIFTTKTYWGEPIFYCVVILKCIIIILLGVIVEKIRSLLLGKLENRIEISLNIILEKYNINN